MKKTLIALSVLVAAGSVNAANVYDNDGVMVDVYGDFAVHYEKGQGTLTATDVPAGASVGDDKEAKIVIDDADFGFNFESAINEQMAIIANMDVTGEDTLKLDDLTVGLKAGGTTVKVGDQVNLVDEIGISNDFAFGLGTAETMVGGLVDSGDQVINVQYDDGEKFYAGFSSTAKADGADSTDEGSQFALKAGVRFNDADVVAYYADGDAVSQGDDSNAIAIKGAYTLGDVVLSALYVTAEYDGEDDIDSIGANIEYSMDKYGFNFGLADHSYDTSSSDFTEYYANVSYAVAKNSTVFFEVQDNDISGEDMGYAAGLTVSF
jgi:predicted porin